MGGLQPGSVAAWVKGDGDLRACAACFFSAFARRAFFQSSSCGAESGAGVCEGWEGPWPCGRACACACVAASVAACPGEAPCV